MSDHVPSKDPSHSAGLLALAQAVEHVAKEKKVAGWRVDPELISQVKFATQVMNEKPADLVARAVQRELARLAETPEFIQSLSARAEALRSTTP